MFSKDDLRNYLNRDVDVETFCRGLSYAGQLHENGYFHYTMWDNLVSMSQPVPVRLIDGTMDQRRLFLLTPPTRKNDKAEADLDPGSYYASFSYGPSEKVRMWALYGKCSPNAIRIEISKDEMLRWYSRLRNVFIQDVQGCFCERDALEQKDLFDIGYYSQAEVNGRKESFVVHRHANYNVNPFPKELSGANRKYAPYFKKDGWQDENEVRLLMKLVRGQAEKGQKVAIDFGDVLDWVLAKPDRRIIRSPWFGQKSIGGVDLADCRKSDYKGELNFTR